MFSSGDCSCCRVFTKRAFICRNFQAKYFAISGVIAFIASVVSYYLSVIIIDMLAPSFASERNMNKSAQLVAYSGTPSYIGALLSFIPVIGFLVSLAAWSYGILPVYLGIGPLKKTPEDKKVIYMIVAFLIMIVLYFILVAILGAVLFCSYGHGSGWLVLINEVISARSVPPNRDAFLFGLISSIL